MKKGTCAMAGFAVSTIQTRGLFCFDPATILRLYCLALTFVFLGTIGALAQTVAVNKPPIADAGPDQTVDSGATITLDASASTVPAGRTIIHYQWLRLDNDFGSYVPVEFISSNRPNPVVQDTAPTLPSGIESRTVYYTLWVTDSGGFESETFSSLTVTVVAPTTPIAPASNKAPEADAGPDQTVASGDRVDLDGSGSTDDDGTVVRYNWRWLESVPEDAPRATLSGFTSVTPWFTAPTLTSGANEISYNLALIVQDNDGTWTDQDKVTVTVAAPTAPPNKAPEADAGSDQTVAAGATVTLDGNASTAVKGPISEYLWTRKGGTSERTNIFATTKGGTASQFAATSATTTFVADNVPSTGTAVTHEIALRVLDADGIPSPKDEVTVRVNPNQLPTANAGTNQEVSSGGTVTLDGSASSDTDTGGSIAAYRWTRTGGTSTTENVFEGGTKSQTEVNEPQLTFTADTLDPGAASVSHDFALAVQDNNGEWSTNSAEISVMITAPLDTRPTSRLSVDGTAVPDGGEVTVQSGATVTLDGSGSTVSPNAPSGTTIGNYIWARTDGTSTKPDIFMDSGGRFSNQSGFRLSPTITFVADTLAAGAADVSHVIDYTVRDSRGGNFLSENIVVTITVTSPFAAPNAVAVTAESEYVSGATVTLASTGSSVDRRRGPISYTWARTGGTGGAVTLSSTTAASPTFTADMLEAGAEDVTHTFTLTVTDSMGATATDTVEVTITAPFADPVARAVVTGGQTTVASGATVMLDGSGSTEDRRRTITTYAWTGETAEVTASLTDADMDVATFTAETLTVGAPDVTHTFTLTVTDSAGETATATVEITVTSNAPPVATVVTTTREFASGTSVELMGSGTDSDSDDATLAYAWTRTTRGTSTNALVLTGETTKTLRFTADTLVAGTTDVTHVFELVVTDTDGAESDPVEVTITVTSPFAAPNAVAVTAESEYVSGATVTLASTGSSVDRRRGPISYTWARTGGTGGAVTLSSTTAASPTFTADMLEAGAEDVTHTFTLTVTDSTGATATDTVEVTITSPFADPVARAVVTGGQTTVTAGETVTLDGSGSTKDRRRTITIYAWTGETAEVTASLTDADMDVATFTAETLTASAPDVTHTFTLTVTDSAGETATATVEITVTSNAPPVASVVTTTREFSSGTSVELMGSGTDSDSDDATLAYAWDRTGGTGNDAVVLTGETTATLSFTADTLAPGAADVTHILELVVTDTDGAESDPVEVTITITSPIKAPVANAGLDQEVSSGATVLLDGTGSETDRRRTLEAFNWRRVRGTGGSVTLDDASLESPRFTADTLVAGAQDVTHVFELVITDSANVMSDPDEVEITVTAPFADPVATAVTAQPEVASGATVTLASTGSSVDRRRGPISYTWARTGGTGANVTLTGAATAMASFTADTLADGAADVTHTFTLTVTDSTGASATDTVEVTVISGFATPVATAVTAQPEVASGATVTLASTGSSVDRRRGPISYTWARTGGTGANVTLSSTTVASPSFTADMLADGAEDVTHTFTLTVTDSTGASAIDTVEVTVTANALPVATVVTTTREFDSGTSVVLMGSGTDSDSDDTTLAYEWDRTGGTGNSAVVLTGKNTTTLSFTADTLPEGAAAVTHIFEFVVTDTEGAASDPVAVTVTVNAPNAPPVAHAGPPPVASGGQVQLDGRGPMVPGRTIVAWAWSRTGGTPGVTVTLIGADTPQPTVMANDLEPGGPDEIHEFTLIVTDDEGMTSVGATVMVTISAPIAAPVANAGPDQKAVSRATIRLDGRGSIPDRRKTIASYAWERTGGTSDSNLTLTGANTAQPSFTADTLDPGVEAVTHDFTLTVTDGDGNTSTDTVTVTVVSVDIRLSPSELMVQEGGTGSYQVRLSESPRRELAIMAVSGNEDVVQLNNARLVFNAGNWNDWQAVEINTVAGSSTDDPVVIRHRLVTDGATSPVPGDVTVTLRPRADDPIPRPVGAFLATRATALINNQPGLSSLLELDGSTPGGGGGGSFTFQATDGQLAMNGGFVHNSVWGKVSGAWASSESAGGTTKSVLASFGVHRKYSEHFLAGAMLQFDLSDHDRAGQVGRTDTIDGTGWLVGPYFAVRHGSQPLYFEGRLLYGQSDNDIRFMDTGLGVMRTGSFDTRRLLAQLRVEGEIAMSGRNHGDHGDDGGTDGPRLRPYADARWIEDRAAGFTDNVNNRVPGQTVSIGQLELGSNVEIPIAVRTGAMTLTGGLGLVWSNTEGDYIPSDSGGRGRGEFGFSYDLDDNLRIEFDSFYDGIGTSRYEGYGLSLSAEMKF